MHGRRVELVSVPPSQEEVLGLPNASNGLCRLLQWSRTFYGEAACRTVAGLQGPTSQAALQLAPQVALQMALQAAIQQAIQVVL